MNILQPSQMGLPQNSNQPQNSAPLAPRILQPSQMAPQAPIATPLQAPDQPQGAQLTDTGSFLGNLGNSIGNFAGAIGNAINHPINTVENIGRGLLGGVENVANVGSEAFGGGEVFHDKNTQIASNIASYVTTRYGSLDAAGKTAYQDPVGFLADFSALASGVGGAVGKLGGLSDAAALEATGAPIEGALTKAGQVISKAGEVTNPISIGGKIAGKVLSNPVTNFVGKQITNMAGAATGAGGSSIREVFNTAKQGSSEAMDAARGNTSMESVISTAQDALDNLKQAKNTNYQKQLQAVKGVEGEIDYQPAVNEFRKQLSDNGITVKNGELQFEGARGFQNPSEQAVLQNAYDRIERWGDVPVNNTLYGLDTLKQQLGDFIGQAQGKAKPVITQTAKTLSEILKQNPEYKNLVEPYETTSNLIDEMKTVVSKNPETALKRLTKAVSQDNEYRQSLIDQLNKYTPNGEDLKAQLAGLNMKSWTNNSKLFTYGEVGTALFNPHLLPAFIASSPRVVAEFLNAMGYTASKIDSALSLLKEYKASAVTNTSSRLNQATRPASGDQRQSKGILLKPIKGLPSKSI